MYHGILTKIMNVYERLPRLWQAWLGLVVIFERSKPSLFEMCHDHASYTMASNARELDDDWSAVIMFEDFTPCSHLMYFSQKETKLRGL